VRRNRLQQSCRRLMLWRLRRALSCSTGDEIYRSRALPLPATKWLAQSVGEHKRFSLREVGVRCRKSLICCERIAVCVGRRQAQSHTGVVLDCTAFVSSRRGVAAFNHGCTSRIYMVGIGIKHTGGTERSGDDSKDKGDYDQMHKDDAALGAPKPSSIAPSSL
jgi:hypothetical protein